METTRLPEPTEIESDRSTIWPAPNSILFDFAQENLLCQYNKEIDDFASNAAAFDNISDHQAQAHNRAQDRDRDEEEDDEGKDEEIDKHGAEGAETDAEVNRYKTLEKLLWEKLLYLSVRNESGANKNNESEEAFCETKEFVWRQN